MCEKLRWVTVFSSRGGVLEDTFWSPWPWPRRSSPWLWPQVLENCPVLGSKTALFLNSWNFVGKRQKPRRKFANTFFVFFTYSITVGKGRRARPHLLGGRVPPNWNFTKDKNVTKKAYCFFSFSFFSFSFFSFSFFLAFFADSSIGYLTILNFDDQGCRVPLNSIFASQFKHITRRKWRVFVLKVAISGSHLAFLWT